VSDSAVAVIEPCVHPAGLDWSDAARSDSVDRCLTKPPNAETRIFGQPVSRVMDQHNVMQPRWVTVAIIVMAMCAAAFAFTDLNSENYCPQHPELETTCGVGSHHRRITVVTGDRECCAPAVGGNNAMKLSEKYRLKALDCENLGRAAKDPALKRAWAEIAIEQHSVANRTGQGTGEDSELEFS
jgi:hypothetical protein